MQHGSSAITVFACPYSIIWGVRANLNSLRALACTHAVLTCIKCDRAALAYIIQLLLTLNALVLRSRALNALAQHATNT